MARLNKYLAACGVCSRREADQLIAAGRVKVNGMTAENGMQAEESDIIEVNGQRILSPSARVVLAYNKPAGVICTERDRHAEKTIIEALNYPVRVTYAGRLDKDSEGLMIMTNDGELIQRMMKGANCHEKEYIVKVHKELTKEFLENIRRGVYLEELGQTTRPCEVEAIGRYTFRIVLTQGLNRQIRRMCRMFGYHIQSLTRIRVVNIELGRLKRGGYREIKGKELETLYQMCGVRKEILSEQRTLAKNY